MLDITRWDPLQEMMSLREAMNRLMEESVLLPSARLGSVTPETGKPSVRGTHLLGTPALDIEEKGDTFIVQASLPGVKPEDVHIEARGNQVTISGQVGQEQETERGNYLVRERRIGQFYRTFTLPSEVKTEGAEATYEHGILTLSLPKSEAARTHQIPLRSAGAAQRLESGQPQAPAQGQFQTPWQSQGQPHMPGQEQSQTPGQGQFQTQG
ncbi:MAG TPA: Hsp20/alpha crystallin family protein [Ktedonobacterales bacterium]|jgi:HSP20 family protein